jgi:cell division transport system permease protein
MVFALIYLGQEEFEGLISLKDYDILAMLALALIFIGIFINWVSTYFAVNKYLNIKTDKLY